MPMHGIPSGDIGMGMHSGEYRHGDANAWNTLGGYRHGNALWGI